MKNRFGNTKNKKFYKEYYFSVEGETEEWYLEYLQKLINNCEKSVYNVKFIKEKQDPVNFVKSHTFMKKSAVLIGHIIDIESKDYEHKKKFCNQLSSMKKAQNIGKQVKYILGYSNYTFELWLILHKRDCYGSLSHRKEYKDIICSTYNFNVESIKEYKSKDIFQKNILNKISLDDVIAAVKRGKELELKAEEKNFRKLEHSGFYYYEDNPSMSVWKIIGDILKDCKLL